MTLDTTTEANLVLASFPGNVPSEPPEYQLLAHDGYQSGFGSVKGTPSEFEGVSVQGEAVDLGRHGGTFHKVRYFLRRQ